MADDALPFARGPVAIAVIHLPPGPGTPSHPRTVAFDCDRELELVAHEARLLGRAGFHALIVENYGDAPFLKERVEPHTVARLALAARLARLESGLPVGINALRNDASAALGAAAASGAAFIRVNVHTGAMITDQGWIEGRAGATLRYRVALDARIAILADVHVKHAVPVPGADLVRDARDAAERGRADGLILSGPATALPADRRAVLRVRRALPGVPLFVGSGVTAVSAAHWLDTARGVIVSSALRVGGRPGAPLDAPRLGRFATALRRLRA
ncbi:MAG: BtpA/SgcQ family protein [Planctomycetota bacterium]